MDTNTIWLAFGLTLLAGMATGIGSVLAFFAKRTNTGFLSASLGFSAGVMIYVSFVEILAKARDSLGQVYGPGGGAWAAVGGFFGGILVIAVIDKLVPSYENPHEMHMVEELEGAPKPPDEPARLHRMGVFMALAIGIHNFPEGMATFTAAVTDPALGTAIAVAVALHNIPEGIAVSVPIYYATGNRRRALFYSVLSGLFEPLGALLGYLVLMPFFGPATFGWLFAGVAGIMVFISLDELLPSAEEYGEHHISIYGLVAGMAVMAVSLLLFI
jgi:ZIP family zinc transporter